ncbi:CLUMA_CG007796, isoform A [Clunio marinus]|uniref:26S proteasome non-ATPase regulatory subunit 8 n=1 Tax=Clunio marinus TaxID=568069 RepID=A0A1J1I784_9DIPT|nr:CLUMA_CG007796, isoform A [Clunio marinus]
MAPLSEANQSFKELKAEFGKPKPDLKKCGILLEKLKIILLEISYMPTDAKASQQELILARDILEIGAEFSVAIQNIQSFERYISQLKCYYYDYKNQIPESDNKFKLLGLNLLFLLSQNRVAEFHTELELLPCNIIQSNKFIKHSLELEQYLMEGRYNKLFMAKGNSPAECYKFFIDILLDTVRNEIGTCLEQAYERISVQEAGKRLQLPSKDAVTAFAQKRKWTLGTDNFYHFASETPKAKEPIPSVELAEMAISYARELEMIV